MSIKSLLSDNIKADQNLQVNSIISVDSSFNDITVTTLNSTTINNSGTVTSDQLNGAIITTDEINFPTSGFIDVPITSSNIYSFSPTYTIYATSTATIVGGLQIYKIGRVCCAIINPFTITGNTALPAENVITSDIVLPLNYRPIANNSIFCCSRININGSYNPSYVRYDSGLQTFRMFLFDDSDFPVGVFSFGLDDPIFISYISVQ